VLGSGRVFRAGTVLGFPFVIDASVLYLGPWVLLIVMTQASGDGVVRALIQLPVILASVFLHELAHALTARALGVPVRHIALTVFGGYAAFWTQPTRWREALIAFAGPACNLLLAALFFGIIALKPDTPLPEMINGDIVIRIQAPSLLDHALRVAAYTNLILGIFNLLPALPLDGGHILRVVLASFMREGRAHFIAAWAGLVLAALLIGYAIWAESVWTLAIGVFIGVVAWDERRAARF